MNLEPLKESEVRKGKTSIICKCINMESRKNGPDEPSRELSCGHIRERWGWDKLRK